MVKAIKQSRILEYMVVMANINKNNMQKKFAIKKFSIFIILVSITIISSGCATPNVKYHKQDDYGDNLIRFALLASHVTIAVQNAIQDNTTGTKKTNAADTKNCNTAETKGTNFNINMQPQLISLNELKKAQIIVTPAEAKYTLRYIEPENGWLAKTNISITYFDTLNVPKTIGVKVEDNSLKLISAIGAVIGVVAAVGGTVALDVSPRPQEGKITLPFVIDYFSDPTVFKDFNDSENFGQEICKNMEKPNNAYGFCYKITPRKGREHSVVSKDGKKEMTMPIYTDFLDAYESTYTPKVPFSRCANLIVYIKKWEAGETAKNDSLATFSTIIADPYHVDWLPLPKNGSITYQGSCDANSSTQTSELPNTFDIIEAAAKQVDSAWKAWNAAKKGTK
jgi:hypothetical protein